VREYVVQNLQRTRNTSIFDVDVESDVEMQEKRLKDVRREIVDRAIKLIPGFTDIARGLGLDMDDVNGLTGLAGLLIYIKSTSHQKSVKYLGLYKAKGRDAWKMKKYNNKAQRYLTMLTNTILLKNGEYCPPRYRDLRKILKVVIESGKRMKFAERGAGV